MKTEWTVVKRGDVPTQAAGIYASLSKKGLLAVSKVTWERLGSPEAVTLLFDKLNNRIGLKPTVPALRDAYPIMRKGKRQTARYINAYRLIVEFGLDLPQTVEFPDAEINTDGYLVLDLRTAKISHRAHSGSRRRSTGKPAV